MKGKNMNLKNEKTYRSYSFEKIDAPVKDKKKEPKAQKIVGNSDLRCKGKNK